MRIYTLAGLTGLAIIVQSSPTNRNLGLGHIQFHPSLSITSDSLHNIHIEYAKDDFVGELQIVYGDCELAEIHGRHHFIGRTEIKSEPRPQRFVWIVPEDVQDGGCLHAFSRSELVGRSNPIRVGAPLRKRQSIVDVADTSGPWFDGVAYMKSKNNSDTFVAAAKDNSTYLITGPPLLLPGLSKCPAVSPNNDC